VGDDSENSNVGQLGRIALKRVAVPRGRVRGGPAADESSTSGARPSTNPANRLVPYLDLFGRLEDAELARLGAVDVSLVLEMRAQVDQIAAGLLPYLDLVDRLSEEELVRLTQASPRTVRFWLLCQPKDRPAPPAAAGSRSDPSPEDSGVQRSIRPDAGAAQPQPVVSEPASAPLGDAGDSGVSAAVPAADSASAPVTDPDDDFDFLFDDDDDDLF
jgi:hypothetical protein